MAAVTLYPDEQALEFLSPYFDMLDALGPAKMNRDAHSAKLSALLARVRQQALDEAAQYLEQCKCHYCLDRAELIRKLASQAAGERTP